MKIKKIANCYLLINFIEESKIPFGILLIKKT